MPIRLSDIPEQPTGPVRFSDVPDQIQPEPAKPINTGGDFGFGLSDYETNALKHFGVSLASGSLKGSAGTLNAVRQLSNLTGRLLGQDVESPEWKNAKRITDYASKFDELAARLDKYNEQTGASKVTTIPGQVIGQLPASVLQWEGNIPLAAVRGFEQAKAEGKGTVEALGSGVKSGIERAVLGKALKVLGRVENAVVRRGGSAVTLGGAAALHGGTLEDILTQAGVGAVIAGKTRPERPVETRRVEPVTPQPPETPVPLGNEKPLVPGAVTVSPQGSGPSGGIPIQETGGKQEIPPPEPGKTPLAPVESTVEKLTDQIKQTLTTQVEARKKLNILYSKERGKRSQEYTDYRNELMTKRGMTAGEATAEASKKFSGELVAQEDLPKGLAPELTDAEWNQLEQVSVEKFPEVFRSNEQMNAVVAIGKIRRGEVLQENEIKLIADMFGAKLARILKPAHSLDSLLTHMADWTGVLTKSIKLGGDVSQTFWNLAPVLYHDAGRFTTAIARGELSKARHQDYSWAKAVRKGWGAFFSQEAFDKAQKAVSESPYFVEAIEHGLAQTEMGEFTLRPNREESFPSKIAAKWPLIKQGNRAQVAMGNTARQNLYDLVREQWKKSGVPVTDARLTKLANFANNLSSRSTVPGGKTVAGLFNFLNITMTSPRNVLARIKNFTTGFGTLNNLFTDRQMAKQSATTVAGWAATTLAAAAITKIMGADIELNPLSADFMKAKWGNKRIDLQPGYGPLARFICRFAVGETKTAAGHYTDKERKKIVEQFVKGWRSPLLNIAVQGWTGRDYQGQPIEGIKGWSKTMADDFLFLWVMDGIDAFKENSTAQSFLPALGAALPWAGMSWTGINVQTYPETAGTTETKTRDMLAKEQYNKNWEDLNPLQQRRVTRLNKTELQTAVTASKVEAAKKNSYDYVAESIGRAKEAGRKITSTLSPESQKALSDLGITIGLEAEVNKWGLNKERYERYQELVGEELRTKLDRVTANSNWNSIRQTRREERIAGIIKAAKERAGEKIRREARRQ